MDKKVVWLVGAGAMALEYAKVLMALGREYIVIGRGDRHCENFRQETGIHPVTGGLKKFLESDPGSPDHVIVTVGIEALSEAALDLMRHGAKTILLEKPGVGDPNEINELSDVAEKERAAVLLAYNRRFYSSVRRARELIEEDGGVSSFNFEFTEWSHIIEGLTKDPVEHRNWFLGNSTHVADTAFYLCGIPAELCAFVTGGLAWHPASSIYAGAGQTGAGALFSYHANWEAPGRWVLEVLTKKRRLVFKPMEKLQVQLHGSVATEPVEIDDSLDVDFKPGLYLQTKAFLDNAFDDFCTVSEQKAHIENIYKKMAKYS